ncbi:hypothetical protein ABH909_005310 [Pseudomonas sp. BS3782 TE3695]
MFQRCDIGTTVSPQSKWPTCHFEAAIHALETEEVNPQDAAQASLAAELKARIMSEYRHQLEVFNDSAEAQALAFQMDLLERRLRLKALRAQRLELYSRNTSSPDWR